MNKRLERLDVGGNLMNNRSIAMQACNQMLQQLSTAILGKESEIERLMIAVLAGGHVLLEDVPGTGKTQLVKSLATVLGGQFRRIQCNPDLLPTDITGVSIFHPAEQRFVFRSGPVHTNVLLADEINRATTKTQSALLEAMEEGYVTVDGEGYKLPEPFILLATQNPIEFEGTYSLPEAQLDRFMMKLSLGYPSAKDEMAMVQNIDRIHPSDHITPCIEINELLLIREYVDAIHLDHSVASYLMSLIQATRDHIHLRLGASPRSSISLAKAARARAFLHKREYVIPDDVKELFLQIIGHRVLPSMEARMQGVTTEQVLMQLLESTPIPLSVLR